MSQAYNQQPANPYGEGNPGDEDYLANDENSNGTRTVFHYDARIRPVHEVSFSVSQSATPTASFGTSGHSFCRGWPRNW